VGVHVNGKCTVIWVEGEEMHRKCGREREGNSVQKDVRKLTAVNRQCSELADHGVLMIEQRFPKCVPRIHDQFPGDKCVHYSSGYFGVYLFLTTEFKKTKVIPLQAWCDPEGG